MNDSLRERYFGAMLVVFLLSFILLASAKWTNNIFYALIALPGLLVLCREQGRGLLGHRLAWGWLLLLLWFLLPALIAQSYQFLRHIAYVGLFVFVVARLVEPDWLRQPLLARAMFWCLCLYIFAYAAYAYLTGRYGFGERVALLPARLDNAIYASIWLVCALALALPAWLRQSRWCEGVSAVVLTLVGVAFVLQTRTALVGAAFLLVLWAIYAICHYPRRGLQLLTLCSGTLALVLWLVHEQAWYLSLWQRGDSYRLELLRILLGEWRACGWWLGCGVEFVTVRTLSGGIPIQHPHSIYVALGLYTGGISLLLFVLMMALTLWYAWRLRDAWGVYLACALLMLNFDGSKLIGNPDELWPLVLLPAAALLGRVLPRR